MSILNQIRATHGSRALLPPDQVARHKRGMIEMKTLGKLAKIVSSTCFLLAAFAISTLGIIYSVEMVERVSVMELSTLKAAGIGQVCKGSVGCGPACAAPACAWQFNPNTNQWVIVQVGGAAGVTAPAATIGTCKLGIGICTTGTPCGFSQVPACGFLANGALVGICSNAGAPAGC